MDFELSEERQMLKDTAERFIREQYPIEKRHAATQSEDGFDRAMWAEFWFFRESRLAPGFNLEARRCPQGCRRASFRSLAARRRQLW